MKKNNMDNSPKNKEPIKQAPSSSAKKDEQGGENSRFPQEYEEQGSMEIRMKPQPFDNTKKTAGEKPENVTAIPNKKNK